MGLLNLVILLKILSLCPLHVFIYSCNLEFHRGSCSTCLLCCFTLYLKCCLGFGNYIYWRPINLRYSILIIPCFDQLHCLGISFYSISLQLVLFIWPYQQWELLLVNSRLTLAYRSLIVCFLPVGWTIACSASQARMWYKAG